MFGFDLTTTLVLFNPKWFFEITPKVAYFFRKSLTFAPFGGFASKWVKLLFFFRSCFFFRSLSGVSMIWVNFAGKKYKKIVHFGQPWSTLVEKKNNEKIWK